MQVRHVNASEWKHRYIMHLIKKIKQQTASFCRKVFDNLDITQSDLHSNSFKLWQETYSSYCVTALNKTRTYVVQRIRHVVFDYVRDKVSVESMPTYEAILSCVNRSIDLEVQENVELWEFYCDDLLPRATGSAHIFGENIWCFERISTSSLPNSPSKLRIPPSTEAFLALCFDNYRAVWMEQYAYKEEHGWKAKLPKPRSVNGKVPENMKKWCSKYTSPDTGSKKWGGWNRAGMEKFIELCATNRTARVNDASAPLELRALELLKTAHNIEDESYAEWMRKKSAKKAKKTVEEPAGLDFVEEE